jgi:hypothetical protein
MLCHYACRAQSIFWHEIISLLVTFERKLFLRMEARKMLYHFDPGQNLFNRTDHEKDHDFENNA